MRRPNLILLLLAAFCCVQQLALAQQPEADDKPQPEAAAPVPAEDTPVGDTPEEPMEESMEEEEEFFTRARVHHEGLVKMGSDAVLKADESAEAVVVIGGNAKVEGKVRDVVVVIGGNLDLSGEVHRDVVVVLGNISAREGASIGGEVVTVLGTMKLAEGVEFRRSPVVVDLGYWNEGLRKWFIHCVLKMRPLAPQVGWVWVIAGFFFLIYFLVAVILPRPVQNCVNELTRRPITTLFMGLLTKLLVPLIIALLAVTGIGLVAAPFIFAALILGAIVGKVALLERLGSGILAQFGGNVLLKPVAAFLIGVVILTLLYMIPVLGLITFGVVSLWGLGCAVTATFSGFRREMPKTPPGAGRPTMPVATAVPSGVGISSNPTPSGTAPATEAASQASAGIPDPVPSVTLPVNVPEILTYPKATFWERMGAAFLDVILLSIVAGIVAQAAPPLAFLAALAYFAGMWAWKGTTIGGIVLGLKVVRQDGMPVSFLVALVRGLAAAFSAIVLFLGFLWIAWDRDKQGWHDRIAGTVVLRLPRGTPLVCV